YQRHHRFPTTMTHHRLILLPIEPGTHLDSPSLPTRRSSDLAPPVAECAGPCPFSSNEVRQAVWSGSVTDPDHTACQTSFDEKGGSEEHTSELQSHLNIVCRLLLENINKLKKLKRLKRHRRLS